MKDLIEKFYSQKAKLVNTKSYQNYNFDIYKLDDNSFVMASNLTKEFMRI